MYSLEELLNYEEAELRQQINPCCSLCVVFSQLIILLALQRHKAFEVLTSLK